LWTGQPPPPALAPVGQPPAALPSAAASRPLAAAPPATPPSPPPAAAPPAADASRLAGGPPAGENLVLVTDQIVRLRRLLDKKLSGGDVTKAQSDGELKYLAEIEKIARAQASSGGNDLSPDQVNALLLQLLRVQKSILQNFIAN
jgi:hypothetical protein